MCFFSPAIQQEVNKEIRETRVFDHKTFMVGDSEQGMFNFMRKASGAVPEEAGRIIQAHNHILCLGRFNYYLQYGPGRVKYRTNNAMAIAKDWQWDGVQQSKMPPESSANCDDSIAVTVFTAGYISDASDVWTVSRTFKRGKDVDALALMDHLFFMLRRVKEDNPYSRDILGKDYDAAQEKAWIDNSAGQYYWRCEPVSLRMRTPDSLLYNNYNPMTPEANYTGCFWYVGQAITRTKRAFRSSGWQACAQQAVYPQAFDTKHIVAHAKLPMLEILLRG